MLQLLTAAAGAILALIVYGVYQRLFNSPIAHISGPKFAALTFWYEFYYDVVQKGRYEWKIKEMHEQYGTLYIAPSSYSSC